MPSANDFESMFEFAPMSLWLEDYSGLRQLFERWREAGVTDLVAHLKADPQRVRDCMAQLQVVSVNRSTLSLFGARDQAQLLSQLGSVFRDDMAEPVIYELDQLWRGNLCFDNRTFNYTLDGRRLDVHVRVRVLPGHEAAWDRVLVSLDDITARVQAERLRDESERYARELFERSPVSLWVEDFSAVKALLDDIRARGITDFATFIKVHPEFVSRCMKEIRVLDVNRETLRMFAAPDKETLLESLPEIFRDEMQDSFAEQLQDLWNGKMQQQREVINYALTGDLVNIHMQFAVLDDRLDSWDLVLVSLIDITARKKAEAYLEYLGKHDVLTQLRNRAFFSEEINRISRKGPWPVSVIAIDMNGLKPVNDEEGHAAGDALLRRVGEVLGKAVEEPGWPARIGGDEFAVVLPRTDERGVEAMRERIVSMLDLNNQFYAGQTGRLLNLSIGVATCEAGESLDAALQRADRAMYEDKARYYRENPEASRRQSAADAGMSRL